MVKLTDKYLKPGTINKLTDKTATVAKGPFKREVVQRDSTRQEKLIVPTKLSDKTIIEWIPNQTSIDELRARWDDETDTWIGKTFTFEIAKQMINKVMTDVIYVKK